MGAPRSQLHLNSSVAKKYKHREIHFNRPNDENWTYPLSLFWMMLKYSGVRFFRDGDRLPVSKLPFGLDTFTPFNQWGYFTRKTHTVHWAFGKLSTNTEHTGTDMFAWLLEKCTQFGAQCGMIQAQSSENDALHVAAYTACAGHVVLCDWGACHGAPSLRHKSYFYHGNEPTFNSIHTVMFKGTYM